MYGFESHEIVGQSVYRLIPETHQGEVTELLNIVKRDLGINRYESKRMRQDGQLFDVSASLSPVRDLQGKVIGAATITRDITLQRKGEERLLAYTDQLETLNLVSQEIAGTLLVPDVIERSLRRLVSASAIRHRTRTVQARLRGGKILRGYIRLPLDFRTGADLERIGA